jgi:hypothetical protein
MTYFAPPHGWPDADPVPNVPTLAEIQLAEELRRRLELQLLAAPEAPVGRFGAVEYAWADRFQG